MKLCLIGEKLSHSYSGEIHNLNGLDYSLCEVKKGELEKFVKGGEYDGFNVTVPYKKEIIPFLDGLERDAESVGAINVVNRHDGKLFGYNTDISGMDYMIRRKGVSLKDKNVMILGTGGTSNTAVALMKKYGAKSVTVVGRNSEVNYGNCYSFKNIEVIINTTPVGMHPDLLGNLIDLTRFNRLTAVFDVIYNPQKTMLVRQAEQLGLITSNGLPMLVEQALRSEDIWLKSTHTNTESEEIIYEITKRKLNIALTGMPSSGKTTVGKALAAELGRSFYDVDGEILLRTKKSAAEIIAEYGEDEFRRIEEEVVKDLSCLSGAVIALGGGSILKEENRFRIDSNAVTVYLRRDLSLLTDKDRPLSKSKGIEQLYKERKALYEQSDITVDNNGDIKAAVKEIVKEYENSCSQRCKP